jgi:hypothetical protein
MPVCDGCGATVDEAHIRGRIERLEMATRYRPIHIQVLLLDGAPTTRPEDFFYREAGDRSERSADSRAYFDALIKCTSGDTREDPARFSQEADALAEFQRQGLFLTNVVECPAGANLDAAISRCTPSLLKRIQFSYKPKYLALLSPALAAVIPLLSQGGWADRLILNAGAPFDLGSGGRGAEDLANGVTEKLVKSVSNPA